MRAKKKRNKKKRKIYFYCYQVGVFFSFHVFRIPVKPRLNKILLKTMRAKKRENAKKKKEFLLSFISSRLFTDSSQTRCAGKGKKKGKERKTSTARSQFSKKRVSLNFTNFLSKFSHFQKKGVRLNFTHVRRKLSIFEEGVRLNFINVRRKLSIFKNGVRLIFFSGAGG